MHQERNNGRKFYVLVIIWNDIRLGPDRTSMANQGVSDLNLIFNYYCDSKESFIYRVIQPIKRLVIFSPWMIKKKEDNSISLARMLHTI